METDRKKPPTHVEEQHKEINTSLDEWRGDKAANKRGKESCVRGCVIAVCAGALQQHRVRE